MLDLNWLRERTAEFKAQLDRRYLLIDLEKLQHLDQQAVGSQRLFEQCRHLKKQLSALIQHGEADPKALHQLDFGMLEQFESRLAKWQPQHQHLQDLAQTKQPAQRQDWVALSKAVGVVETLAKQQSASLHQQFMQEWLLIPNLLAADVPQGKTEQDNLFITQWGKATKKGLSHVELAKHWLDSPRATKIAKSRFSILQGPLANLHRGLSNFMLDVHVKQHGYVEICPPYLNNYDSMLAGGQLPKFAEEVFVTKDELYLIPTSEIPLVNLYRDEILPQEQLPLQYAALTPCFRREAGSYGKDTQGILRQHQFHKVELVWFTTAQQSVNAHQELLGNAEKILQLLELPYQVVNLCAGDIGFAATKTYDIEVWMPAQNTYREISSCSNCWDFQARRANIRCQTKSGNKAWVHTLNGSGLAVGRTLAALLENHCENSVLRVPPALQVYLDGQTELKL